MKEQIDTTYNKKAMVVRGALTWLFLLIVLASFRIWKEDSNVELRIVETDSKAIASVDSKYERAITTPVILTCAFYNY